MSSRRTAPSYRSPDLRDKGLSAILAMLAIVNKDHLKAPRRVWLLAAVLTRQMFEPSCVRRIVKGATEGKLAAFTAINLMANVGDAKVPCCAVTVSQSATGVGSPWCFQTLCSSLGAGAVRKAVPESADQVSLHG